MKRIPFLIVLLPVLAKASPLPMIAHSHVNGNIAASTTVFIVPGDSLFVVYSTETYAQIPIYSSMTLSGMYVQMESNNYTSNSVFTIRINGVSGNQTVTLGAGVLRGTDTTHTDVINYGDKVDVMMKTGTGSGSQPNALIFLSTPAKAHNVQKYTITGSNIVGLTISNGFQPYYTNIVGAMDNNLFESQTCQVMRSSGTFQNESVYVMSNSRVETTTMTLRKNGVDTGLTVSIGAGSTGLIEDKTHSVNFVIGDTMTWGIGMNNGSDSNPIRFAFVSMEMISTMTALEYDAGSYHHQQNPGETWTIPYKSTLDFGGDEYQMVAYTPGTLSNICVYTGQNDASIDSTLQVRVNGSSATTPVLVTIPAGQTGAFCDNTHSVIVRATDTLAYLGHSPSGTGSFYYDSISAKFTVRGPSDDLTGLQIFPSNNIWNTRVDGLVVSSSNTSWMDGNNGHTFHNLHADFGNTYLDKWNGIPYNIICSSYSSNVPVTWDPSVNYADQSDTLPVAGLPIPPDALAEGDPPPEDMNTGTDLHLILVDTCTSPVKIYETFASSRTYTGGLANGSWITRQLSTWTVTDNNLRPDGWTSADAGGLPILPGLVRWEEVQAAIANGTMVVPHAFRFTLSLTHGPHIWPARHDADTGSTDNPPFGMWVRLKSSFDVSGYSLTNQVILNTLKKFGMPLADNGGDWYISGAPSPYWDSNDLGNLAAIVPHDSFEVVNTSVLMVNPNSAQAQIPSGPVNKFQGKGKFTLKGKAVLR